MCSIELSRAWTSSPAFMSLICFFFLSNKELNNTDISQLLFRCYINNSDDNKFYLEAPFMIVNVTVQIKKTECTIKDNKTDDEIKRIRIITSNR